MTSTTQKTIILNRCGPCPDFASLILAFASQLRKKHGKISVRVSWGKGGRCVRLTTLPPSCAVVMKYGNLNFLEPSGPLQVCNGTALPLPFIKINGGHSSRQMAHQTPCTLPTRCTGMFYIILTLTNHVFLYLTHEWSFPWKHYLLFCVRYKVGRFHPFIGHEGP